MKKRFTMLDLLVVIAIIAILAGLLLLALSKAREKDSCIAVGDGRLQLFGSRTHHLGIASCYAYLRNEPRRSLVQCEDVFRPRGCGNFVFVDGHVTSPYLVRIRSRGYQFGGARLPQLRLGLQCFQSSSLMLQPEPGYCDWSLSFA